MPNSNRPPRPDQTIDALAGRQHGTVSRTQLLRAGVSADQIDRRVRSGRLHLLHRGVYRVGPVIASKADTMAAVLACGDSACASHHTAAALWTVLQPEGGPTSVEIIVTRGRAGRRPGIRVRHIRSLHPGERTVCDGVPATTPARTLLDLAANSDPRTLERAVAEALALDLVRHQDFDALMRRHPRQPGMRRLHTLIAGTPALARTRSEAEERLLALIRKAGLPLPATNVSVAGREVDFLWRAERLIIEVDGHAFHRSAIRFERDRRRDAALVAAGLSVMRVTWRQITAESESLLVRIAQALARRSAAAG